MDILDYFCPVLTAGQNIMTQSVYTQEEDGFVDDDEDDEWLVAMSTDEGSNIGVTVDIEGDSNIVTESQRHSIPISMTEPSSSKRRKPSAGGGVEEDIHVSRGVVMADRLRNDDDQTIMMRNNDNQVYKTMSDDDQVHVQHGNNPQDKNHDVSRGGDDDRCMFNDDKTFCGVHDSVVRMVKVTSLKWRWKPKVKEYGNVSVKERKYICTGRGLVKRGPDNLCTATQPRPTYSGEVNHLGLVRLDRQDIRLKREMNFGCQDGDYMKFSGPDQH